MHFQQFSEYLHERSVLIEKSELSAEKRQVLGQVIMQEEDDWLDWKVAQEMIESWIGLRQPCTLGFAGINPTITLNKKIRD